MKLVEYDVIEFKINTDRSKVDPYDRLKLKSVFPVRLFKILIDWARMYSKCLYMVPNQFVQRGCFIDN